MYRWLALWRTLQADGVTTSCRTRREAVRGLLDIGAGGGISCRRQPWENVDMKGSNRQSMVTRRHFLQGALAAPLFAATPVIAAGGAADAAPAVTFLFAADVHACRMGSGLSPNCAAEGKTDAALLRHIRALNGLEDRLWPDRITGQSTGFVQAGRLIGRPAGLVLGGDLTDDGGGQTAETFEGSQILQFSHRYQEGTGPDRVHMPVYVGLGNHDLDQDGRPPDVDWYRNELRDYVRFAHEPSALFHASVPAANFDGISDSYSWDWGDLHLVQLHRFGGNTRKDAGSALDWLRSDLADNRGKPVVLFQHYGWDPFSLERWDPAAKTFDDHGSGEAHWWTEKERTALLDCLQGAEIMAIFHGHQHDVPMIYQAAGYDVIKPKAAFMGGFALVRFDGKNFEVALGEASDDAGGVMFTNALRKQRA